MTMTTDSKTMYESEGYLTGIDILTEQEITDVRQAFAELEEREGPERCQIGLLNWHMSERFIWEIGIHPRLLEAIEDISGSNILLLATHFFCKYPKPDANNYVAWHQDITYWGLEPPIAHTAWLAIDDSDVENGCMRVIPGSHKEGILPHGTSDREGNLLSIQQEIPDAHVDESSAVDVELKAGQVSIHDGHLLHASNPNRSTRRRCGLTVRYVPTEVKQSELNSIGQTWSPILVRGEDHYKHFEKVPRPF